MHQHESAFTLLELIITLCLSAILITIAAPSFIDTIKNARISTTVNDISRQLSLARETALQQHTYVKWCGSSDKTQCSKTNMKYLTIFIDKNNNHRLDDKEEIIRQTTLDDSIHVSLRAALGREYLAYTPEGYGLLTGSIIICENTFNNRFARRITLNRTGRWYHGKDNNKDGIIDDTSGQPLTCPQASNT